MTAEYLRRVVPAEQSARIDHSTLHSDDVGRGLERSRDILHRSKVNHSYHEDVERGCERPRDIDCQVVPAEQLTHETDHSTHVERGCERSNYDDSRSVQLSTRVGEEIE